MTLLPIVVCSNVRTVVMTSSNIVKSLWASFFACIQSSSDERAITKRKHATNPEKTQQTKSKQIRTKWTTGNTYKHLRNGIVIFIIITYCLSAIICVNSRYVWSSRAIFSWRESGWRQGQQVRKNLEKYEKLFLLSLSSCVEWQFDIVMNSHESNDLVVRFDFVHISCPIKAVCI